MKDSVSSSVIILDSDGVITGWNKKAVDMFGINTDKAIGKNISKFEFTDRQRLHESLKQCKEAKKSVMVKSLSFVDSNNNRFLTNTSQTPLFNNAGEFKGIMMVIDDVTNIVAIQAELNRKNEEIKSINKRFQETYKNLKLASLEKNSTDRFSPELQINRLKSEIKPEAKRFIAGDLDIKDHEQIISEEDGITIKGDVRIQGEIDKRLDASDNSIKTKKLKDEELK